MKRAEYIKTRRAIEGRLADAQALVDSFNKQIGALDIVWNEVLGNEAAVAAPQHQETLQPDRPPPTQSGKLDALIQEALDVTLGTFHVADLRATIYSLHPELGDKEIILTTLSGRLRRLVEAGKIDLIEAGKGRRPSTYLRRDMAA